MSPMKYARMQLAKPQYTCLKKLWTRESHWNHLARNEVPVYQIRNGKRIALHAFGIAQLLGERSRDPITQVNKGLRYVAHRYQTPCKALAWHVRHNWY